MVKLLLFLATCSSAICGTVIQEAGSGNAGQILTLDATNPGYTSSPFLYKLNGVTKIEFSSSGGITASGFTGDGTGLTGLDTKDFSFVSECTFNGTYTFFGSSFRLRDGYGSGHDTAFQIATGHTADRTFTLSTADQNVTLNVGTGGTLGTAAYTASTAYQPVNGGATVNKVLTATASIDFDLSISNEQSHTITVTGASVGDAVLVGLPSDLSSFGPCVTFDARVSAANTVTVRALDPLYMYSDPGAFTFRVVVFHFQ